MFLVGLELDTALLRKRRTPPSPSRTPASSCRSCSARRSRSALSAVLVAATCPFTVFALFLGVVMSVTAFPVLARILTDRGMQSTRIGVLALTCAAVDDVTAWCLLAFVVSVVEGARSAAACCHDRPDPGLHRAMLAGRAAVAAARVRAAGAPRRRDARRLTIVLVGAAAVGAGDGVHRHPRHLRRVPARRPHPARVAARARAAAQAGGPRGRAVAAGVLRLHRHAHADRPGRAAPTTGWSAALIIVAACSGKFGGSFAAARLPGSTGATRRRSAS